MCTGRSLAKILDIIGDVKERISYVVEQTVVYTGLEKLGLIWQECGKRIAAKPCARDFDKQMDAGNAEIKRRCRGGNYHASVLYYGKYESNQTEME